MRILLHSGTTANYDSAHAFTTNDTILFRDASGSGIAWSTNGKSSSQLSPIHFVGKVTNLLIAGGGRTVVAAVCQPDTRTGSCSSEDVGVWNGITGKMNGPGPLASTTGQHHLAITEDGRFLATAVGRAIELWDLNERKLRWKKDAGHQGEVQDILITPHGETVVSTGCGKFEQTCRNGDVRIWDTKSEQLKGTFFAHTSEVTTSAISQDGDLLATASRGSDTRILIWNMRDHKLVGQLVGAPFTTKLAFSADGQVLASASQPMPNDQMERRGIQVWDLNVFRQIVRLPDPTAEVSTLSFDTEGHRTRFAAADRQGGLVMWDLSPDSWLDTACAVLSASGSFGGWGPDFPYTRYEELCPNVR